MALEYILDPDKSYMNFLLAPYSYRIGIELHLVIYVRYIHIYLYCFVPCAPEGSRTPTSRLTILYAQTSTLREHVIRVKQPVIIHRPISLL
jgi:hypothetical protein